MNKKRGRLFRSPSVLRIRLSRHLAFSYLTQAAFYMVLVLVWLYWYVTYLWNRIGPDSGGRIELPRIVLFLIGFGLPVAVWFLYTIFFIQKPLRYLDDLLGATAQLASDKEQPIVLPEVMKEAENELNEVRLQSILDERTLLEQEEKKNDLIMYLAHDLKTPLTSVMGYLALLEENPDLAPEQRARYIGIARAKAERLEELIGEFFDITRLSLTSMTLNRTEINFSRMLEQIVSESEVLLEEKGLHWRTDIEPGVSLSGDADKLQRVFDNLIRNAVSYSYPDTALEMRMRLTDSRASGSRSGDSRGAGHRDIDGAGHRDTTGTGRKDTAGAGLIRISLRNSGPTIPKEKLRKLFDQFYRLDESRGTDGGGAGLGLAIAKEIVELHGGTITAESENESITFSVTLPV